MIRLPCYGYINLPVFLHPQSIPPSKSGSILAPWILFSFSFLRYPPGCIDDAFYPTLGYLCGLKSPRFIPAIVGLETLKPTRDDLKAFSAAFGTSSSAAMFHLVGLTPEAVWREVWHFGSLEMGWPTWNGVELFQAVFFQSYICKRGRDGKISISQVCCPWLFSFSITATVVLLLFSSSLTPRFCW